MPNSSGSVSPASQVDGQNCHQCGCCPEWVGVTTGGGGTGVALPGLGGGFGANDGRLQPKVVTATAGDPVDVPPPDELLDDMEGSAGAWFSGIIDGGGIGSKTNSPPAFSGTNSLCLSYGNFGPPQQDQVILNVGSLDLSFFVGIFIAAQASFSGCQIALVLQSPGGASATPPQGVPNGSFGTFAFDFGSLSTVSGSGADLADVQAIGFVLNPVQSLQQVYLDELVALGPDPGPGFAIDGDSFVYSFDAAELNFTEDVSYPGGSGGVRMTYKTPDGEQGARGTFEIGFNAPLDVSQCDAIAFYFIESGDATAVTPSAQVEVQANPGSVDPLQWQSTIPQPRGSVPSVPQAGAPAPTFHGHFGLILECVEVNQIHSVAITFESDNPDPTVVLVAMGEFVLQPELPDRVQTPLLLIEESTVEKDWGSDAGDWSSSTVLGTAAGSISAVEDGGPIEGASALEVSGDPTADTEWVQVERSYTPASEEIDISSADVLQVWVWVDPQALGATPGQEVFFGLDIKDGGTAFTFDEFRLDAGGWHLIQFEVAAAVGVTSIDRVVVGMRGGDMPGLVFKVDTFRVATLFDAVERTKQLLNLV